MTAPQETLIERLEEGMKSKISNCLLCLLFFSLSCVTAGAEAPYQNYIYSFDGEPQAECQAYLPTGVVTGNSLGTKDFNQPEDIFAADNGKVYIADTGNNRILILTADMKLESIIEAFGDKNNDRFNNPCGVFVTPENELYVADTDNSRIVVFDENRQLRVIYNTPDSDMLVTPFQPLKTAVDLYGRMYVVSRGCEKGFIQLEKDGTFLSYYGAIQTTLSPSEALWRLFMTEEQKRRTAKNTPTVYSNVVVDRDGFVFGTVSAAGGIYDASVMIRKLNPLGVDILKRDGVFGPRGDIELKDADGQKIYSKFVDISVRKNGVYSVLDSEKKRIFTYDCSGDLMYVFGAKGAQLGTFDEPAGMDITPWGDYFVIDSKYNHVVIFKPTEYALLLDEAIEFQYRRNYIEAEKKWNDVLKYTSKSDLAYNNLGKIMMVFEKYEDALFYFKLGSDREYYSAAFKYYRKLLLNDYFHLLFAGLVVVIVGIISLRLFLKWKRKKAIL